MFKGIYLDQKKKKKIKGCASEESYQNGAHTTWKGLDIVYFKAEDVLEMWF